MADTNTREMASSAATQARHGFEDLKEKGKEAAASATDMAGAAKEKVEEWTAGAKDKMRDAASATADIAGQAKDKFKEWSAETVEKAEHMARDAGHELTTLVRRYPLESVLVGLAIGFLLAKATTRS